MVDLHGLSGVLVELGLERARQVTVEGRTAEHDDEHKTGELAAAAGCYATHASCQIAYPETQHVPGVEWPFEQAAWKPKTPRRNLVIAAALIIAEIQRLDRAGGYGRPAVPSTDPDPDRFAVEFAKNCAEQERRMVMDALASLHEASMPREDGTFRCFDDEFFERWRKIAHRRAMDALDKGESPTGDGGPA